MVCIDGGDVCNNEMRYFELCKWEDIIVFWLRKEGMIRLSVDYKLN